MDEELAWFRQLPADQRSWVSLVAQAGVQSYVDWLRSPDDVLRMTGEVFASAPRAMARSVTLQQTVELVRLTIAVAEDNLPALVGPVRCRRGTRTAAALQPRDRLRGGPGVCQRGGEPGLVGRAAGGAGDRRPGPRCRGRRPVGQPARRARLAGRRVDGRSGRVRAGRAADAISEVHRLAATLGVDAIAGVHGGRLIVAVGGSDDPEAVARRMLPLFGLGPVVVGPLARNWTRRARSPGRR